MPVKKLLNICCGFGRLERTLAKLGVANQIHSVDIAKGAIKSARKRAQEENLHHIT